MDARLLDMLQNAPDVDVLTVAQGIDVALIRTLEEAVQVDGVVGAHARGLSHVLAQALGVVGDHHAAAAMASGCVPMIFTPLSASARVRLTGV